MKTVFVTFPEVKYISNYYIINKFMLIFIKNFP